MLVRRCPRGVKLCNHATATAPDLDLALAQLPPFLVPSFAFREIPRERQGGAGSAIVGPAVAGPAPTSRRATPLQPPTVWHSISASLLIARSAAAPSSANSCRAYTVAPRIRQLPLDQGLQPARTAGKGKGRAAELNVGSEPNMRIEGEEDVPQSLTPSSAQPTDTPSNRKALMRLLNKLPRRPSREEFRDARACLKAHDALDDTALVRALAAAAIRSRNDDDALRLAHECAKLIAVRRPADLKAATTAMYEQLVAALDRAGRWDPAIALTNDALALGIVSHFILSRRIRALHERQRYIDAIATFRLLGEHGFEPDWRDYDEAVSAHLLNGELHQAQDLLAEKASKGLRTTSQTCIALLGGMVRYGGNRVMEERLLEQASQEDLESRKALRQDQRVLNKVLSVRAARGALPDALAVLAHYDFDRYPGDLVNAFLSLASPTPRHVTPHASQWRPQPDAATIVSLVSIALRQQQPHLAQRLLVASQAAGVQFNDHIAACLVRVLLALHDLDAAERFIGDVSKGVAKLGESALPALEPSVKVYELLLGGMLRYRGIPGANACLERLSASSGSSMRVTEGMTRALVDHLALESDSEVGISAGVLMQINRFTANRMRPSVKHLNTLLRAAWMRERRLQHDFEGPETSIEDEFPMPNDLLPADRSRPRRLPPRPKPAAEYVSREAELLVSSGGRHETSVSRMRLSLADRDVRHDRDTSRHILRNDYLIRYITAKWDYLQTHVVDLGVRPSHHHVAVLMRAYLRLGDAKGARLAMQYALDELGLEPHAAYFSTLISGLARLGEYHAASSVYAEFKATGLAHDRNLYAALAMLAARQRDVKGVERVFALMQEHVRGRALVPQLQAQALRLTSAAGRSGGGLDGGGLPSTMLTPYDPELDAIFLTIMYRALVGTNRYLAAQKRVHDALRRGLIPDRLLLRALMRTRKWVQWKAAAATRVGAIRTSAVGRQAVLGGEAALAPEELAEVQHLNALNITHVRKMLRRMKPAVEKKELRGMLEYWERAEKEAAPLGESQRGEGHVSEQVQEEPRPQSSS
ncbi:hypothetical protein JCM3770_004889 [Rhodotorula araucariae]